MMHRLPLVFVATLIFVFVAMSSFSQQDTNDLIRQLHGRFSKIKTIQATLHLQSENVTVEGKVYAGAPNYLKMDLILKKLHSDSQSDANAKTLFVLNRETLWMDVKNMRESAAPEFLGKCNVSQLRKDLPDVFQTATLGEPFNPIVNYDLLREASSFLKFEKTRFNHHQVYLVDVHPRNNEHFAILFGDSNSSRVIPHQIKLWIDSQNGITYKIVAYDSHGKILQQMSLSKLVLNSPVDVKEFSFSPPPHADVVNLDDEFEEEIHSGRSQH